MIVPGHPEESMFNIALSLLLPHLEPYLIRSMNAAKPHVTDPGLKEDLLAFNAQEGQHYRAHRAFNDAVNAKGFPMVARHEERLAADYHRFSTTKSLAFNLAYAEGFEAMTMALARVSFELRHFDRMHRDARDLFAWHLVEELEHRTVTYDVYKHVVGATFGSYLFRLIIGTFAQLHMFSWIAGLAFEMWQSLDASVHARHGGLLGTLRRLVVDGVRIGVRFWPKLWWTFTPWYSPHRVRVPDTKKLLAEFASAAIPLDVSEDATT